WSMQPLGTIQPLPLEVVTSATSRRALRIRYGITAACRRTRAIAASCRESCDRNVPKARQKYKTRPRRRAGVRARGAGRIRQKWLTLMVYVSGSVTVGAAGLSKTSTQYAPARNGDEVVASSAPTAAAGMVSAAVQTP